MWRTTILLGILLCLVQGSASAETMPSLEISPNMKVKDTALNSNAVLFCQPNVEDVTLLDGLRWLDIEGKEIQNDARKYTEKAPVRENPTVDGLNLIIKSFQKDDSGEYTCTADYKKTTLKASIQVVPYLAITFVNAPPKQHPIAGEGGLITCVVEAQPEAEIHWYKDGHLFNLDEVNRCAFEKEGIRCSSFSIEDNGNYSCQARVRQFGNADERAIIVDVYTKPIIQHPTGAHQAKEGESLLLKCTAEGNPKPTYSWHDAYMNSFKGRLGFEVDEIEGTLEINQIARADAGYIRCVARNAAGNDSRDFKVEVIVKPKILKFENKTIAEGDVATLECHVEAEPSPKVTFTNVGTQEIYSVEDEPLDETITVIQGSGDGDESTGKVLYVLKFDQARRKHDGLYRCSAENDGGFAEATGHLEVQYSPVILNATNVLLSWINNAVNISCISSAIPNASIMWEFNDRPLDSNITVIGTGSSSTIMVFPNSKLSFGNYSCKAKNKIGEHKHTVRLLEATVPGRLLQVVNHPVTATTVTFQLYGPEDDGGFPVTEFVVKYKLNDKAWDDPSVKERRWKIKTPYIIEKLQPESVYIFRFAAINEVGTGPFDHERSITMPKKAAPEEPVINRPEGVPIQLSPQPDQFQLSWEIPKDNGESITFYEITYFSVRNSSTPDRKFEMVGKMIQRNVTNAVSTSYTIEGLSPNTYYRVELRAHNVIGFSTPNFIYIKTARDPVSVSITSFPTEITDTTGESALSMAGVPLEVIIGAAVAILLIVIVIIDVGCYVTSKTGILMFFCVHVCKKHPPSDKVKEAAALEEGKAKDSKEIMTTGASNPHVPHDDDEAKDATEETPMIDGTKKEKEQEANRNAVENDVNMAKDSAV